MQIPADKDYLIKRETLDNIANAIRDKKGTTELIKAEDMASEIASISSGGGEVVALTNMQSKTATNLAFKCEKKPICVFINWIQSSTSAFYSGYCLIDAGFQLSDTGYNRLYEHHWVTNNGIRKAGYISCVWEATGSLVFTASSSSYGFVTTTASGAYKAYAIY